MCTVVPRTLKSLTQTTFIATAPAAYTALHRCQYYRRLLRNASHTVCSELGWHSTVVWDTLSPLMYRTTEGITPRGNC